jgi:uncharacterized membrane protein
MKSIARVVALVVAGLVTLFCADHFVPSGFFAGDHYDTAWFDMYGVQASGIATSGNPATSLTWTIGNPGEFT